MKLQHPGVLNFSPCSGDHFNPVISPPIHQACPSTSLAPQLLLPNRRAAPEVPSACQQPPEPFGSVHISPGELGRSPCPAFPASLLGFTISKLLLLQLLREEDLKKAQLHVFAEAQL